MFLVYAIGPISGCHVNPAVTLGPLTGVSIGFTLAVIHLISIPIDNTSVNPARSFAVAPYQPGGMGQVWL